MSSKLPTSVFTLNLDFALINHLRSFKNYNDSHHFEPYYIEKCYAYLYYYQGNMEAEIFDEFCQQNGGLSLKQIVLHIHFMFGSIANLKDLLSKLKFKGDVVDLSKSQINRTNIHCVHSIIDL